MGVCGYQISGRKMAQNVTQSIRTLIDAVDSSQQADRLARCIAGTSNVDKEFYLVSWDTESSTAVILGTKNANGRRSEYKVKVGEKTIGCNCPDSYNACKKHDLVCKHVCFVVIRVCKIYSLSYFNSLEMTESERQKVLQTLNDRSAVALFTKELKSVQDANTVFVPAPEELQDVCPICYDDTTTLEGLVKCPTCRHTMHNDCIRVWLMRSQTCVLCRSDVWRSFK